MQQSKRGAWVCRLSLTLGMAMAWTGTAKAQAVLDPTTAYTQNFNGLAISGTTNAKTTLPTGWDFSESGSNGNTTYAAGTGSDNAGNTYSFGASSNTERAFGMLQSGSLQSIIGARFSNQTGGPIAAIRISYTGEHWRLSAATDRLDFQYSTNATSLSSGTWTDLNALDFTTPTIGAAAPLNGNDSANRVTLTATFAISVPKNGTFWIRWSDASPSSSAGMAIDDFSIKTFPLAVSLTALRTTHAEQFDTLPVSGTGFTAVPAGWIYAETGNTPPFETYAATDGSASVGETYSVGSTASDPPERAFGQLMSDSLAPMYIGVAVLNDTGETVNEINVDYIGEQWRWGGASTADSRDRIDFAYSLDAIGFLDADATWTAVDALDFASPMTTGAVGALDGNADANRVSLSHTINGLSIPDGEYFWLRWQDFNIAGNDDLLAIDGVEFSVDVSSPVLAVTKSATPDAGTSLPGDTITYTVVVTHDAGSDEAAELPIFLDTVPDGVTPVGTLDVLATVDAGLNRTGLTLDAEDTDLDGAGIDAFGDIFLAEYNSLPLGETLTITFAVTVDQRTAAGTVSNVARVEYESPSIPGDWTATSNQVDSAVAECAGDDDCTNPNPTCVTAVTCVSGSCTPQYNTDPCDLDSDLCTLDTCSNGVCTAGSTTTCNDGNDCTDDYCDPSTGDCQTIDNADPCDDGYTCTTGDTCGGGVCAGTAEDTACGDDGFSCSDEVCDPDATGADPTTGCIVREDLTVCGSAVACAAVTCEPGNAGERDPTTGCVIRANDSSCTSDGNVCTDEVCDLVQGCIGQNNTAPCTDNDKCTNDVCSNGSCGVQIVCDDGKTCTTDACDEDTGLCVATPVHAACDDTNVCTDDTCDPASADPGSASGCVYANNTASCTDSDNCTQDICANGACGVPIVCDDGFTCTTDSCDPSDGSCDFVANNGACADGNACTDDVCDTSSPDKNALTGCVNPNNTAPCAADGDACTDDVCAGGACYPTTDCDDHVACTVDSCDPTTGCANAPNNGACTSDGNVCTDEVCDPVDGCKSVNNTAACVGTNLCLEGDTCSGGSCQDGTTPRACSDGNVCTDDSCNPATGCVFTNNTATCDDGNLSTANDRCSAGSCAGTTIACPTPNQCQTAAPNGTSCPLTPKAAGTTCDDGNLLTNNDVCNGAGACLGVEIVCPAPAQCELPGTPNGFDCNKNYKPAGTLCNDGLTTTANDQCNATGTCAGTTIVCPAPSQCELPGTPNGTDCTKSFKPTTATCNDGNLATHNDRCDGLGGCAGVPIVCDTPNQCQTAGTPDGVSCVLGNKPDTAVCDDADLTTAGDHCDGQGDCVGTPITCPEDTTCATYAPNGADCTMTPRAGECDDGLATTHGDTCQAGECAGTAYTCVPAQCEATSVANGVDCTVTNKAAGELCDDGALDTRDDACDGQGGCAGTSFTCTPGVCEATSVPDGEGCISTPAMPGTACDDLDPCTVTDACDGAGGCAGSPVECEDGEVCDLAGECQATHCEACEADADCGTASACLDVDGTDRCLVACDTDVDCALNQVCRAHASGGLRCFDVEGLCQAPAVDPEVVEPGPEEVEPQPEEVEPEPEAEEVEPGPEPTEPQPEVAEPTPDASAETERERFEASGGGCTSGAEPALWALLGLGLVGLRRRRQR